MPLANDQVPGTFQVRLKSDRLYLTDQDLPDSVISFLVLNSYIYILNLLRF